MKLEDKIKLMEATYVENKTAIDKLLAVYDDKKSMLKRHGENIFGLLSKSDELKPLIHSVRYRLKDKDHFKDKLIRKAIENNDAGAKFDITPENLFQRIQDLVGVRILHIHSDQITDILNVVKYLLGEDSYKIIEEPIASIWDLEYKDYYEERNIKVIERKKMYTSIHLIISSYNRDNTPIELQIRTLAEELWGEVSHTVNYPHETSRKILQDQLAILARITSASTRLVDTIFKINKEHTPPPTEKDN
ncbi:MAG: RelA/SpoT domain-containing protein [Ignavibacteria bacterium]|nr:RelA/SpoT domain-containing protein [Ignavibacteria bacterium]